MLTTNGTTTSVYGFAGEQTDATGLVYLRARYYEAGQGRFITRDMWEGDYEQPLSLNRWNYVQANPVNLIDPSGLSPLCQAIKAAYPQSLSSASADYICSEERLKDIIARNWPNGLASLIEAFQDQELFTVWRSAAGQTSGARFDWLLSVTYGTPEGVPLPIQFKLSWGTDCGFAREFHDSPFYSREWNPGYQEEKKRNNGKEPVRLSEQVGHFLTAAALGYHNVNLGIYSDEKNVIGHEMFDDTEQKDASATIRATLKQSIGSANDADVANFRAAIRADQMYDQYQGTDQGNLFRKARDYYLWQIVNWDSRHPILTFGGVDPKRRGNSLQDARLTVRGFDFAQWIRTHFSSLPQDAAVWLRDHLTRD